MTQPTSVPGRNSGFTFGTTGNLNSDYAVTYGYDIAGRLKTVTDANGAYAYGYLANSRLREQVIGPVHTVTTIYEPHRDVLTGIENKAGATVVSNYAYVVNNLGKRKERVNSGTAFGTASTDVFTYNDKGEVTGSTNATLTARDQAYTYDDIGNRVGSQLAGASTTYTANSLNQYTELVTSGQQLDPDYDLDGNQELTGAGQVYRWDGENRLIAIEPLVPTTGDKKQLNTYDAQSRRVRKQVSTYASGTWSLTTDEKFVYDGWNVVAVLDATSSNALLRTYTWGTDLSGSLQGAGGVGGLLSTKDGSSVYHYTYDANGNVSEVLNSSGGIAAHYEYDAFGNTVASSGIYASTNAYRFSTKPLDSVGDLYYYGFRYYNPSTGGWLIKDPIMERGGLNLYGFVNNDPLGAIDYLGRMEVTLTFSPVSPVGMPWTEASYADNTLGDTVADLAISCECEAGFLKCELTGNFSVRIKAGLGAVDARRVYGHEQQHVRSFMFELRLLKAELAAESCNCAGRAAILANYRIRLDEIHQDEQEHSNQISPEAGDPIWQDYRPIQGNMPSLPSK